MLNINTLIATGASVWELDISWSYCSDLLSISLYFAVMSSEKDEAEPAAAAPKVVFKKVKNKNHCRRRKDDSDEDDSGNGDESLM